MPSRLSYVWLSLKRGLGSRTAAEVLDAFGSPEAVFAADRQALTAAPCELRKTHVDLLCDKDTVWPESRRSDRHNACPSGHDNRQRHGARQ